MFHYSSKYLEQVKADNYTPRSRVQDVELMVVPCIIWLYFVFKQLSLIVAKF